MPLPSQRLLVANIGPYSLMPGLDPGIHVFQHKNYSDLFHIRQSAWIPGSSPSMRWVSEKFHLWLKFTAFTKTS
jgi:hypothetical protein